MFYLLPSWIWFNTELYYSCEAAIWKLHLGHLLALQHWPWWLKQLFYCRLVSPGMKVGDAFLVPSAWGASPALCSCSDIGTSLAPALVSATLTVASLENSRLSEAVQILQKLRFSDTLQLGQDPNEETFSCFELCVKLQYKQGVVSSLWCFQDTDLHLYRDFTFSL